MELNRAWIYCRVANNDNNELSNQYDYVKDYAAKQGLEIVGTTQEIGNELTFPRKELKYMLNLAKEKKIDVILVKDMSCIGSDVAKTLDYIEEVKTYGVEIYGVKIMKMLQSSGNIIK